jgi:hypothetical protein
MFLQEWPVSTGDASCGDLLILRLNLQAKIRAMATCLFVPGEFACVIVADLKRKQYRPGCSMEPFESKQIEIDGHHGADAQNSIRYVRYRSRAYSDV